MHLLESQNDLRYEVLFSKKCIKISEFMLKTITMGSENTLQKNIFFVLFSSINI